jgi:DNA-directed RNA polymerase subunit K/omega
VQSSQPSKDPDILASAKALRRAAKRALELGRRTGTPVDVLKRGKIVDIAKNEGNRGKKRG